MLELIFLTITTVLNIILGLVVISSSTKKKSNIWFIAFTVSVSVWQVSNYFANRDTSLIVFWNRLTFAGALFMALSLISTLRHVAESYFSKLNWIIHISGVLMLALISLGTSLVVRSVGPVVNNSGVITGYLPTRGVMYPFLLAFIIYIIVSGVVALTRSYRNSVAFKRRQLQYVLVTFVIGTTGTLITNAFLPIIFNNPSISALGPVNTLFIVCALSYIIIKHRLFDIRLLVVRAVAYLFSTASIVVFAGLSLFFIGKGLVDFNSINVSQWLTIGTGSFLLAISYQPILSRFNKLTSKIFYRDAYETQEVLDKVSSVIVGSIDPKKVQKGTLSALSEALRPSYMVFLLAQQNGTLHRGSVVGQQWNMHDPELLHTTLKSLGKKITLYDEIEEKNIKYKEVLRVEDISVVAPLVTKDEIIGYLLMGAKKSGNIFNSQDFGLLNIATNELAVALQNTQRFEEIQSFNITLQDKVTDATRELKSTNKKLIALDEAKDEFISMASHQLRTPLTSIKGYLSMMVEGDLGEVTPAQEKALKEAFGSSQRMVYLIADFLNVSRIRTGKFMIETKEVDLPQIVTEEITQLREMAGSRDLTLVYDQPGVFPRVRLDDNKIRQVMMNMVDNAIYYTPSGGIITIQLYSTGEEILFKVIDSGIGVPKTEQHKLFTKFYRAGNARKSRPDGTGLGLFMAQKIIVEQGGAIIFESTEGKGSTFGFRFPLTKIKV